MATRYDKTASSYEAAVNLASFLLAGVVHQHHQIDHCFLVLLTSAFAISAALRSQLFTHEETGGGHETRQLAVRHEATVLVAAISEWL
ncbi:hypothetical protein [Streptomyces sp. NPDC002853]